jgi:hypothetical protein
VTATVAQVTWPQVLAFRMRQDVGHARDAHLLTPEDLAMEVAAVRWSA